MYSYQVSAQARWTTSRPAEQLQPSRSAFRERNSRSVTASMLHTPACMGRGDGSVRTAQSGAQLQKRGPTAAHNNAHHILQTGCSSSSRMVKMLMLLVELLDRDAAGAPEVVALPLPPAIIGLLPPDPAAGAALLLLSMTSEAALNPPVRRSSMVECMRGRANGGGAATPSSCCHPLCRYTAQEGQAPLPHRLNTLLHWPPASGR